MLNENKLGALGLVLADAIALALGDVQESAAALLLTLHHHGPASTSALARICGIAQPTAVRVLDGLVRRGWVERAQRSGRTAQVRLTGQGEQRASALRASRLEAMARLLAPLAEPERALFVDLLDRLLAGATRSRSWARTSCRLCDHDVCDGPLCPIGARAAELERATELEKVS